MICSLECSHNNKICDWLIYIYYDFIRIDIKDYINQQIDMGFSEVVITSINSDGLINNIDKIFHKFLSSINYLNKIIVAGAIWSPSHILSGLQ